MPEYSTITWNPDENLRHGKNKLKEDPKQNSSNLSIKNRSWTPIQRKSEIWWWLYSGAYQALTTKSSRNLKLKKEEGTSEKTLQKHKKIPKQCCELKIRTTRSWGKMWKNTRKWFRIFNRRRASQIGQDKHTSVMKTHCGENSHGAFQRIPKTCRKISRTIRCPNNGSPNNGTSPPSCLALSCLHWPDLVSFLP